MDRKKLVTTLVVATAAVFGYFLYAAGGRTPSVDLSALSVGDSYDPYAFWAHTDGGRPCHLYPDTVGRNVLSRVPQAEDMGLALKGMEVAAGASCSQS